MAGAGVEIVAGGLCMCMCMCMCMWGLTVVVSVISTFKCSGQLSEFRMPLASILCSVTKRGI